MAWSVGVSTKRGSRWSILDKEEDWVDLLRTHNPLNILVKLMPNFRCGFFFLHVSTNVKISDNDLLQGIVEIFPSYRHVSDFLISVT